MTATLGVGELARLGRTTVRTLQWYDRIGLLPAGRDTSGRRCYRPAQLGALQQIQLLVAAGMRLEQVAEVMHGRVGLTLAQTYAAQADLLELQELRLRCQHTVLGAVARVLEEHPQAAVPTRVLTAVIDLDATLLQFPHVTGQATPPVELDDAGVAAVLDLYFAWKAAAVQALLLIDLGIPADSPTGRRLGRDYRAAIRAALGEDDPHHLTELHRASRDDPAGWPEADRELHDLTEEFLERCEAAAESESSA